MTDGQPVRRGARPSLVDHALRVTATAEDGGRVIGTYDFGSLRCGPALQSTLAHAFANRVDVGGEWRSEWTMRSAFQGLVAFVRWADDHEQRYETVESITPALYDSYTLSLRPSVDAGRHAYTRALLLDLEGLREDTRVRVDRRAKRYKPSQMEGLSLSLIHI